MEKMMAPLSIFTFHGELRRKLRTNGSFGRNRRDLVWRWDCLSNNWGRSSRKSPTVNPCSCRTTSSISAPSTDGCTSGSSLPCQSAKIWVTIHPTGSLYVNICSQIQSRWGTVGILWCVCSLSDSIRVIHLLFSFHRCRESCQNMESREWRVYSWFEWSYSRTLRYCLVIR